jgi:hypothetical protein
VLRNERVFPFFLQPDAVVSFETAVMEFCDAIFHASYLPFPTRKCSGSNASSAKSTHRAAPFSST